MSGSGRPGAVTFRPLERAAFPLVGRWLRRPDVARWWADDPSPEGVEAMYGGVVDGTEPAEAALACVGGRPVGLVQRYALGAYPEDLAELAAVVAVPDGAWSVDYLVGEEDAVGRGWGTAIVAAWTAALWAERPEATAVVVPVHALNRASWRALERAGYRRVGRGPLVPDNPADTADHVVYVAGRPPGAAARGRAR